MANEYFTIKPSQFSDAIYKAVQETVEEDYEVLGKVVKDAASAARKSLSRYSGNWVGFNRVGHDRRIYTKGWKVYNHRRNLKGGFASATVANKNEPSLTHLLEFGHRLVRKGTVYGHVKAFPHFAKAEAAAQKVLDAAGVDRSKYIGDDF